MQSGTCVVLRLSGMTYCVCTCRNRKQLRVDRDIVLVEVINELSADVSISQSTPRVYPCHSMSQFQSLQGAETATSQRSKARHDRQRLLATIM